MGDMGVGGQQVVWRVRCEGQGGGHGGGWAGGWTHLPKPTWRRVPGPVSRLQDGSIRSMACCPGARWAGLVCTQGGPV